MNKAGRVFIVSTLALIISLTAGCFEKEKSAKEAVKELLTASYQNDKAALRKHADFEAILSKSLRFQKLEKEVGPEQRKALIETMVDSMCGISKADYDRAIQTLEIDTDKGSPNMAVAVYSTMTKNSVTLTLEKKNGQWVVTSL